jgi:hypothetical protein
MTTTTTNTDMILDPPCHAARALFIGINYTRATGALNGCVADVNSKFKHHCRFGPRTPCNTRFLIDDTGDLAASIASGGYSIKPPTKANIEEALQWIVADVKAGELVYVHYSGHGTQVADDGGGNKEADGKDEALCPADYPSAGMIRDDYIREVVDKIPAGARFDAHFDCCHSGTIADLATKTVVRAGCTAANRGAPVHVHQDEDSHLGPVSSVIRGMDVDAGAHVGLNTYIDPHTGRVVIRSCGREHTDYLVRNLVPALNSSMHNLSALKAASDLKASRERDRLLAEAADASSRAAASSATSVVSVVSVVATGDSDTQGIVVVSTGCADEQTSADAFIDGDNVGASTTYHLKALNNPACTTYAKVLEEERRLLKANRYAQIPQLCFGREGEALLNAPHPFHVSRVPAAAASDKA